MGIFNFKNEVEMDKKQLFITWVIFENVDFFEIIIGKKYDVRMTKHSGGCIPSVMLLVY